MSGETNTEDRWVALPDLASPKKATTQMNGQSDGYNEICQALLQTKLTHIRSHLSTQLDACLLLEVWLCLIFAREYFVTNCTTA
jgi:hypothetical protein